MKPGRILMGNSYRFMKYLSIKTWNVMIYLIKPRKERGNRGNKLQYDSKINYTF